MVGTRAKITVVAGLLFALLFIILGFRELRRPSPTRPLPVAAIVDSSPPAAFAIAARRIETGETLSPDLVRNGPAPKALQAATASPAEVIGKVATRPIAAGAAIPRTAIAAEDKLALRVPVGMRAISIDTTSEIAVAGLVRPGDRVDIQVVYPGSDAIAGMRGSGSSQAATLLQMVEVLAVGQVVIGSGPANEEKSGSAFESQPAQARNVTLALTPADVSTLSLAKARGAIYLSLRNPADRELVGQPAAKAPQMAQAQAQTKPAARPRPARRPRPEAQQIELVVGDQRQIIYSGGSASN
ncbi:Flp pilus assembly protein CpaB [Sphingomonas histidinilytica]|uniref:Pilus assembly protein CpaB n=1 Tax=Rhizorhabdus histidinilytica TaxID=439228 RepID=A0A1T5AIS3_9SPHN|nr:Flp pilus assembly protein CpaB [Rhizorhabdus histidinilytica]MBO9376747.1 Flp pilus assembly protein CpaB [Rhizorhabdus histidinilytica]SKB34894.1 pilus assembly protein CpaB [Rhizorhabdus histidinilytica]